MQNEFVPLRKLPKSKINRTQMTLIRDILQHAFTEGIRESPYAWLLENSPEEWSGQGYRAEQELWELASAIIRIAESTIEKHLLQTSNNG